MPVFGAICEGICSQSKHKKDNNRNAPEEVEATAAATSTTTTWFKSLCPLLTEWLYPDNNNSETNDVSDGSSYKEDIYETEKDSTNLGNDAPPVNADQSHASVVEDWEYYLRTGP